DLVLHRGCLPPDPVLKAEGAALTVQRVGYLRLYLSGLLLGNGLIALQILVALDYWDLGAPTTDVRGRPSKGRIMINRHVTAVVLWIAALRQLPLQPVHCLTDGTH